MAPRIENTYHAFRSLAKALEEAGVEHDSVLPDTVNIAGRMFHVLVHGVVRETDAALIAHYQEAADRSRSDGEPTLVVADRISAEARETLIEAGVAWLDRRGHLWVRTPTVYVNADVAPTVAPPPRVVEVLSGTGFDVAVALLGAPEEAVSVNGLARRIKRSPGRVSEILSALRDEGLVEGGNRPAVPDLFWNVAERWHPRWTPLSALPPLTDADRYRLSGTLGALSLGAPLVSSGSSWPSLYVDTAPVLSALASAYGRGGSTAVEVALCPSRFGASLKSGTVRDGILVAHPVIVALDLAQDRARGREILDGWEPIGGWRVW